MAEGGSAPTTHAVAGAEENGRTIVGRRSQRTVIRTETTGYVYGVSVPTASAAVYVPVVSTAVTPASSRTVTVRLRPGAIVWVTGVAESQRTSAAGTQLSRPGSCSTFAWASKTLGAPPTR